MCVRSYSQFSYWVALRKESVDRNVVGSWRLVMNLLSLSARRAWIEIGIDFAEDWLDASLSARRAWIEILGSRLYDMSAACRSPQGERG